MSSSAAVDADQPSTPDHSPGGPMDGRQRAEAREYNRRSFQCDLLDRLVDVSYLTFASCLLARPLDTWLQQAGLQSASLRLVALYLVVTLLHTLVSLPLAWYSGHQLEHRYGLSRQTLGRWLGRYCKRHGLTMVFGSLLTLGLYSILWSTGPRWWLVAAAAYFVLSIVLGQLMPVLILPLFYKIEPFSNEALNERLARLAAGTGLTLQGVYRMKMSDETVKANAMLAGLGATRRVILGDTLLDRFSPDEIGIVFAHEVGHHVHRHVPKMIAAGLLYTLLGFGLCDALLRWWSTTGGQPLDYATLPVWTQPFLTLMLTLFGMVVEPTQNLLSRHFERQADTYALDSTRQPDAYRSAFEQLARLNKSDPDPNAWEVFLFHSHPPIAERLRMADAWSARQAANA